MMCADNYWLSCDNRDRLVCMVNDIIEELFDLDMEPKAESLWWTTLRVGSRGSAWNSPFVKSLKSWGPLSPKREGIPTGRTHHV